MLVLTLLTLLLTISVSVCKAAYTLEDDYGNDASFFDKFSFFTDRDPTNGFVNYVDRNSAQSSGLVSASSGPVYIGVDHTNHAPDGRSSVRITSTKSYQHGLFVLDLAHMPGGVCGAWPAFWLVGDNWPNNGEVDIIEGANDVQQNAIALHSGQGCSIDSSPAGGFTGSLATANCDIHASGQSANKGCSIDIGSKQSYGSGFNGNKGGVYATEWTSEGISVWFFPRGSVPQEIQSGGSASLDPSRWDKPVAKFSGKGCDWDSRFKNMQIVFDITFCGDWASNSWSSSPSCAASSSSCHDFVANNASAFDDAYWAINSLRVYKGSASPSSSSSSSASFSTSIPTSVSIPIPTNSGASPETTSGSATMATPSAALRRRADGYDISDEEGHGVEDVDKEKAVNAIPRRADKSSVAGGGGDPDEGFTEKKKGSKGGSGGGNGSGNASNGGTDPNQGFTDKKKDSKKEKDLAKDKEFSPISGNGSGNKDDDAYLENPEKKGKEGKDKGKGKGKSNSSKRADVDNNTNDDDTSTDNQEVSTGEKEGHAIPRSADSGNISNNGGDPNEGFTTEKKKKGPKNSKNEEKAKVYNAIVGDSDNEKKASNDVYYNNPEKQKSKDRVKAKEKAAADASPSKRSDGDDNVNKDNTNTNDEQEASAEEKEGHAIPRSADSSNISNNGGDPNEGFTTEKKKKGPKNSKDEEKAKVYNAIVGDGDNEKKASNDAYYNNPEKQKSKDKVKAKEKAAADASPSKRSDGDNNVNEDDTNTNDEQQVSAEEKKGAEIARRADNENVANGNGGPNEGFTQKKKGPKKDKGQEKESELNAISGNGKKGTKNPNDEHLENPEKKGKDKDKDKGKGKDKASPSKRADGDNDIDNVNTDTNSEQEASTEKKKSNKNKNKPKTKDEKAPDAQPEDTPGAPRPDNRKAAYRRRPVRRSIDIPPDASPEDLYVVPVIPRAKEEPGKDGNPAPFDKGDWKSRDMIPRRRSFRG